MKVSHPVCYSNDQVQDSNWHACSLTQMWTCHSTSHPVLGVKCGYISCGIYSVLPEVSQFLPTQTSPSVFRWQNYCLTPPVLSPSCFHSDVCVGQSQDDSIVGMKQSKQIPPALPVSGNLSSSNPDLLQSHHRILDFNNQPGVFLTVTVMWI